MKILITVLLISNAAFAQQSDQISKPAKESGKSVETLVKEGKKDRKKKVQMCHDCGKPESQCDCEGEEHKKEE